MQADEVGDLLLVLDHENVRIYHLPSSAKI